MQLNDKRIRNQLSVATASLLTAVAPVSQALESSSDWEVDTSVLYYSETDRVTAWEPVIRLRKDFGNDRFLTFKTVIDSLTGSSANGAIATGSAQTFTTPSGNSTYTTPANTTPLDPSFHDTRVAVNLGWEQPIAKDMTGIIGFNASNEYDYQSLGLSGTLKWDFNQKNSTLTAGLAYNADTVKPVGGLPVGFATMPTYPAVKPTQGTTEDKTIYDLILGWTQVLSRKDILQLNYVYGNESGYLTDPYKILTLVDGTTGDPVANPYVYEKRPDDRTRHALYAQWNHQFTQDVLRMSYRYFTDDWGIDSHTVDMRYRYELGGKHFLEPHFRYYTQTAADFYHTSLINGQIYDYASADYRLADLVTTTFGIKYGYAISDQSEFGIRLEQMNQQADPSQVIGNQASQDLVPDVDATILQFNYTLLF
ncbi:MAG: hypothetical protein AMJ55_08920 [Gammaproteobacteria bacterium SG8_15]|nr:MAG: hypothetical protein AMJ55_08920 [Gammaproteobacteria bacterium SG8_15]